MRPCLQNKVLDQAVKYIEDLQEDFDFRYKTLQSRGELCFFMCFFFTLQEKQTNMYTLTNMLIFVFMCVCGRVSDLTEVMKHEVLRLQEMLNSLDFKRKVCICIAAQTL